MITLLAIVCLRKTAADFDSLRDLKEFQELLREPQKDSPK